MALNSELMSRRQAAVVRGVGHATPIFGERALNSEIWDVEGKRYIDFAGGIAVLNTGHRHLRIMQAVRDQLDRFTHTCFQVVPYDSYVELAERLIREHRVAVIPGTAFGMTDGCHFRVAYGALQKETVAEGIGRLVRGLRAILT